MRYKTDHCVKGGMNFYPLLEGKEVQSIQRCRKNGGRVASCRNSKEGMKSKLHTYIASDDLSEPISRKKSYSREPMMSSGERHNSKGSKETDCKP